MKSLSRISALLAAFGISVSHDNAQADTEFVPVGSTWKYLDNGSNQGTAWRATGFNDASWASGPAELGFGDGGEATLLTKGPSGSQYRTFYFRRDFNVTAAQLNELETGDAFYQLVFSLKRDDGAIVYLNGEELFRDAMPTGTVNYLTLANQTAGGATESTFFEHVVEGSGKLDVGTNVLAVEIHQATTGSSDISFDLGMSAVDAAATYGSFHPPQQITFEEAGEGSQSFFPSQLLNDDLGWEATELSGITLAHGAYNFDPGTGQPFYGYGRTFAEGYCYAMADEHARISSQISGTNNIKYRVDLRNYTNVEVSFDVKAHDGNDPEDPSDDGDGFESSDYIRFSHLTSTDGVSYTTTQVLNLQGGGNASIGSETLVAESASKKVLVPTSDIGVAWRDVGYADGTWTSGSGGVGYERSSANTYDPYFNINVESQMYGGNQTVYVRIPFDVADKDAYTALNFAIRYDDGFIAYLNGVKVAEANPPGGTPVWNSAAPTTHADGAAVVLQPYNLSGNLGLLNTGANVLAIHGLNKGNTSSDFLMSCLLEARKPGVVERNDPPQNLIDIDRGLEGPYYRYTYPIDDSVNSYAFIYEGKCLDSASPSTEALYFDNFLITGDPIAVDSYGSFIQLETSLDPDEDGLEFADPDSDGIVNYLEFAFRGDPEVAAVADDVGPIMPQVRTVTDTGGQERLELSWRQLNVPADGSLLSPFGGFSLYDIKYIPQWSTDGINWNDAATGANSFIQIGEAEPNVETPGEPAETVTITAQFIDAIPLSDPGTGEFLPLLVRVKVESYKLILP